MTLPFLKTNRLALVPIAALVSLCPVDAAETLNSLKITEVVENVTVLDASSKRQRAAQVNGKFSVPDLLNTGANSRAEMIADDGTVTRVGSNTTFSFSPNKREINLEKGSVLFHSPVGKGGGVINAGGATAAVLGTTIIVSATTDGGFKMLVLEGKAKATLLGGKTTSIAAGQLIYILPGARDFAPPTGFRLQSQVTGSALVNGFKEPLQSMDRINQSMNGQEKRMAAAKPAPGKGNGPKESKGGGPQENSGNTQDGGMTGGQPGGMLGGGQPPVNQGTQNFLGPRTMPVMLPTSMQQHPPIR